jgi:hypothetical protein
MQQASCVVQNNFTAIRPVAITEKYGKFDTNTLTQGINLYQGKVSHPV